MADISLLFDVSMTGGVDTNSEELIRSQLEGIVNRINAKPLSVKFQIDQQSLETMRKQISDITHSVSANQTTKAVTMHSVSAPAVHTPTNSDRIRAEQAYINVIDQIETKLGKWTAAEKSNSQATRAKYAELKAIAEALRATYQQYLIDREDDGAFNKLTQNTAHARLALKQTEVQVKSTGDATKTLTDRVGGLAEKFATWFSVSRVVMAAFRAMKQMVNAVVEIDTAMTELKKVTNETDATYDRFLNNAANRAKQLGATISDVVTASADFARLGFNISEAEQLADAATVYKNVGDGISDISTASESIIATMQAFGVEAKDVMSIVDKFNNVGNNYAISSKGVGDALLRSAAAMRAANNTLDETIALATAANTVVQDPEKVGR